MPRKKAPKMKLKKSEKDALKAAKDGGKQFLKGFTKALDAEFPRAV